MNFVTERQGLGDDTVTEYRNKTVLLDVTYVDPHAVGHMRASSDTSEPEARRRGH